MAPVMPKAVTLAKLDGAIAARAVVRLGLKGRIGASPFGVPIARSDEVVLLTDLNDYRTDGYVAVPLKRVAKVRCGPFEHAYERLTIAEGIMEQIRLPEEIRTDDFVSLFNSLRKANRFAIIESHRTEGEDDINTFLLGPITGLSDSSVSIHPFDAEGNWNPKPTTIPFADILYVQWSSRYIDVWQRHVPPRPV